MLFPVALASPQSLPYWVTHEWLPLWAEKMSTSADPVQTRGQQGRAIEWEPEGARRRPFHSSVSPAVLSHVWNFYQDLHSGLRLPAFLHCLTFPSRPLTCEY